MGEMTEAAVSKLAGPFRTALPYLTQHLDVLERSGLVRSRKPGRVCTCMLAPQRLRAAEHWLSAQRLLWERRLDSLDSFLKSFKETER